MESRMLNRTVARGRLLESSLLADFALLAGRAHQRGWELRLRAIMKRMSYRYYSLSFGPIKGGAPARPVNNFPRSWQEYYDAQHYQEVDPIVRHCRQHLKPLFWERAQRRARGRSREFWEAFGVHGMRGGVSIPLRDRAWVGSLSVAHSVEDGELPLGRADDDLGVLFMLVPYLIEGLQRRVAIERSPESCLTHKEAECLGWASVGKTSWEIGRIIGCAERTVDFHIANAGHKLGSTNRGHAIGIAVSQGLISF
ncbi:LuxR family transcriptional regulator [Pseudomonas sp. RIT-To-2]|uniref:LuxR family transcriptional regulator n=1 Tax=Pseudomonas sp. RIT-To-2 TaxID=3462541 RepID=UPI00241352BD